MERFLHSGSFWPVIATGIALSLGIYGYYKWASSVSLSEDEECDLLDLLLPEETEISTATFYAGNITEGNAVASRMMDVVQKNHWLTSELVKRGSKLYFRHQRDINKAMITAGQRCYQEVTVDVHNSGDPLNSFDENTSLDKITETVEKYLVKNGSQCINKPEPLFKITVIKYVDKSSSYQNEKVVKSVLLFSLSHVFGDGFTFYTLYSFLDPKVPIRSLTAKRKLEFADTIDEIFGKAYQDRMKGYLIFGVILTLLFGRKPVTVFEKIDPEKIQKLKEKEAKNHPSGSNSRQGSSFVSTNDIICSWFFQTMKRGFGMMAINFRNRLSGYHNDLAGNYEGLILYPVEDSRSPWDIRESIQTFKSKSNRIPLTWKEYYDFDISVISNWAGFYHHLAYPDTEFLVHYPLLHSRDCVLKNIMVIFAPNEQELAVFGMLRSVRSKEELKEAGKEIFKS